MMAVSVSIADRTAFPTQSPSAICLALALSSGLESPTESAGTALCTAFSAYRRETSARVPASVVAPWSRRDEAGPDRRLVAGVLRRPPAGREDAENPALLRAQQAGSSKTL